MNLRGSHWNAENQQVFKVREHKQKGRTPSYMIIVPIHIGKLLAGGFFTCELTEEGILYRPSQPLSYAEREQGAQPLPAWVREKS